MNCGDICAVETCSPQWYYSFIILLFAAACSQSGPDTKANKKVLILNKSILEFIKSCIRNRNILWTYHVNMRLQERLLSRKFILDAVDTFEIIEEYPTDRYLPSFLVYAEHNDIVFHVHIAVDMENNNVRIVTSYCPAAEKWENDLKTRRKP